MADDAPASPGLAVRWERSDVPRSWPAVLVVLDGLFFLLGAAAAAALAVLTVRRIVLGGIADWWLLLVLWLVLAYLLLPRIHSALALVYVPDYFIGRSRTYEGLLADPVNVALLGTEMEVHTAMSRAGWRLADELGFRSGLRTVTTTLTRRTYPTAPVSPAFLFGRMQDFTYQQEVEGTPARRHHVRFWHVPDDWFLPGGARVDWLAAGTYDKRVGLSVFTLQVTHKVAIETDRERDHIVRTVLEGNPDATAAVLPHFSSGYHSRNGGGDSISTDGDLPVLDLTALIDEPAGLPATAVRVGRSPGARARVVLQTVRDTASSNRIKRPMTVYVGYGLLLLRAAAGVTAAVLGFLGVPGVGLAAVLDGLPPLLGRPGLVLVVAGAAAVALVALGQLTFAGSAIARMLALTASTAAILAALLAGPAASAGLGAQVWLVELVLDIGALITLSSGDVRDFDLRMLERRRDLRARRRQPRSGLR
ncbi:LssY C-terminal domain-containing protein [Amnibacterium sp. CER49]|uniref:LssY C-terminal domain-containing protein n=1 Tax=Amnibacterium sp. CER49 TaxID=3039161 RepID=UPI00244946AB|nr:LssY C-terminal domain-containing protein [Amnibacterium sp. CER49]MDH2443815.1 LssY C-terminal domain-containing protein [Amnibacterium sp. CER49]